jgi:hypothetical protein
MDLRMQVGLKKSERSNALQQITLIFASLHLLFVLHGRLGTLKQLWGNFMCKGYSDIPNMKDMKGCVESV